VTVDGREFKVELKDGSAVVNGKAFSYCAKHEKAEAAGTPRVEAASGSGEGKFHEVRTQVPGVVVRLLVKPGDAVKSSTPIMVLEAMKMENAIIAGCDGVVAKFEAAEGGQVQTGALLAVIKY